MWGRKWYNQNVDRHIPLRLLQVGPWAYLAPFDHSTHRGTAADRGLTDTTIGIGRLCYIIGSRTLMIILVHIQKIGDSLHQRALTAVITVYQM